MRACPTLLSGLINYRGALLFLPLKLVFIGGNQINQDAAVNDEKISGR